MYRENIPQEENSNKKEVFTSCGRTRFLPLVVGLVVGLTTYTILRTTSPKWAKPPSTVSESSYMSAFRKGMGDISDIVAGWAALISAWASDKVINQKTAPPLQKGCTNDEVNPALAHSQRPSGCISTRSLSHTDRLQNKAEQETQSMGRLL